MTDKTESNGKAYNTFKVFIKDDYNASFMAGGIAGAISRTVVSPFERAKILLQLQKPGQVQKYKGMFPTIAKMYKEDGWRGMFRGNLLNCIRIFPYSAVQYAVFEKCKHAIRQQTNGNILPTLERLISGSIGGIVSVYVTYPLDLIRVRLTILRASMASMGHSQLSYSTSSNLVWGAFKEVVKNEGGIRALYKGVVPTTLGVAPFVAINFTLYEKLREFMAESPRDFSNPLWKLSAGAFSSFFGGVIIYPLDVLRRRYQVASMGGGEMGFQYRSVAHALVSVFTELGFFGAYRGLTANLYKIVPSVAVTWLCYDTIKEWIAQW